MSISSDIILNHLLDGVLIVDVGGRIIFANVAAEKLLQLDELIGQYFGFPVNPQEVQEIELFRNNQLLTLQMLATTITWHDKDARLISLRDITELKNTYKHLIQQKARLEEYNLELEQYASFVSHDLKEPIRKIIYYSNLILSSSSSPAKIDDQKLMKIHSSARRMSRLIDGIGEYARYQNVEDTFKPVDLNEVLDDVLADLEILINDKGAIVNIAGLPVIPAIRMQMHQLFMNLLSNSIKYAKPAVPPVIEIATRNVNDAYEISVSDNGIGFGNDDVETIFKPFRRLEPASCEGSGIGLAICKKIIERHAGKVAVRSVPGEGATFLFTLRKQL